MMKIPLKKIFFWLWHVFKGGKCHISSIEKTSMLAFFQTPLKQDLSNFAYYTLHMVYIFILGLISLTLFQDHSVCQKYKQFVFFRFLSTVD